MKTDQPEHPIEDKTAQLERAFIDEYLRARGHSRETLDRLPDTERHKLIRDACVYAGSRLSEIESRAHLIHELHADHHS